MKLRTATLSILAATGMVGTAIAGMSLVSSPAAAQASAAKAVVDDAKRKGLIGETAAGYLAVVGSQPGAEVMNAMNEINIGRKAVYTRLARAQNVQVEVVAALTGEKQLASAARGEKIMDKTGRWVTVR